MIVECPYADSIWYALFRIDPSKTTMEYTFNNTVLPSHIDPEKFCYTRFHKIEKDQSNAQYIPHLQRYSKEHWNFENYPKEINLHSYEY